MKHKLPVKFWTAYFIFLLSAVLLFFILAPSRIYDFLLKEKVKTLQLTAEKMAEYPEIYCCNFWDDADVLQTRRVLTAISQAQGSETWLVNKDGRILMDSQRDYPLAPSAEIPNFSSLISDHSYWITGNFLEMFHRQTLSVVFPVTSVSHTTDFIIIHYALYQLRDEYTRLMTYVSVMLLILFLTSLIFPVTFYLTFYRPLHQTIRLSNDCANGNVRPLPTVSGNDEFSILQTNLTYMAEEIQKSEEGQRKFVSNISHDFRSPLTSIKGYAEAMLDGTVPPESRDKYLDIIRTEAERLNNLTQNILISNSLKEGGSFLEKSVFDINPVIQLCVTSMEIQCRQKDLHIVMDLPLYPQNVCADKEKIQQVIYNLLDNAIKFSYPHSTIHVSTTQKKRYVFISVKDHGEGIPAEDIPKIWNRFYKSDSSRGKDKKGTGLGLSIVREIIRAHDQNINVISTKGVGSEFIFTLDKAD